MAPVKQQKGGRPVRSCIKAASPIGRRQGTEDFPFTLKIWALAHQIPPGHVSTYTDIAQAIGKPKGLRAVGHALARNPLLEVIPCHRVLTTAGRIGGYGGSKTDPKRLQRKRELLASEGVHFDPDGICRVPKWHDFKDTTPQQLRELQHRVDQAAAKTTAQDRD
ncbi:6-O-methylguanine DNA methyltransferase [Tribonema minus]|uniref:Methylated-DNA--protein-cysteine methyltransferase n=1 Tax=Tribonema minus TaxID=303371 RepID=A0A835ZD70_9STRA|nr:6-O-methylguanine DNA methyltransferase [Tribonema minus]